MSKVLARINSGIENRTFIKCGCGFEEGTPYTNQSAEKKFKEWGWDVENKICPFCIEELEKVNDMKYTEMTDKQKRAAFWKDVLGHDEEDWWYDKYFRPLTDLNHAMMGVEKFPDDKYYFELNREVGYWNVSLLWPENEYANVNADTPHEAIVEACLRITTPELFEEDDR